MKQSYAFYVLHIGFLLGLFLHPEDRGEMFLQNTGWLSTDYIVLYSKKQDSPNHDTLLLGL
jgi:hypothetical protein